MTTRDEEFQAFWEDAKGTPLAGKPTAKMIFNSGFEACARLGDWQPIETAPKDGTNVLCICMKTAVGSEQFLGKMAVDFWENRYSGFGRFNSHSWPATHWMPLPSPPRETQ